MSNTHRLKLPLIHSGQAQKEITHNEALNLLDVLIQPIIQSVEQKEVPENAKSGELYIIGTDAEGAFTSHTNEIAQKQEQGWRFIAPFKWMRVTLDEDGSRHCFNGKVWQQEVEGQYVQAATISSEPVQQIQNDYLIKADSGEYLKVIHLEEELELKGAHTDTKIQIPHHSIVVAVNIRVIKAIQGASSFSVGTDDDKARYGSGLGSSQDTTNVGLTNTLMTYWYDKSVRITADNGSFSSGLIKVTVQLLKPHGPWNWD